MPVVAALIQRRSYLSDARGVPRCQGRRGELVPCCGRGVAGALLQLVPEFGHLRVEQRDVWGVWTGASAHFLLSKMDEQETHLPQVLCTAP